MTDTFQSRMWRICAHCLGDIRPQDRACMLYDEIACMDCLSANELMKNRACNDGSCEEH